MKTTASFDDHSFSCAHEGFLPTSSSWLGCNLAKIELKRTINRNADKQAGEDVNYIPNPQVVHETSLGTLWFMPVCMIKADHVYSGGSIA
jgi:hypothetical protein